MPVEVIMPNLGASSPSSTLLRWLVQEGETVHPGQPLFEAESDKAAVEVESAAGGVVGRLLRAEGETVPAGEVVALLLVEGERRETSGSHEKHEIREKSETRENSGSSFSRISGLSPISPDRVVATPVARRLARAEGIDLAALHGSGPEGRIVEADVRLAVEQERLRVGERGTAGPVPTPQFTSSASSPEPLSGLRRITALRLSESARTAVPVTLTTEVRAEALAALRVSLQQAPGASPEWITYDLLLAWLAAKALAEHPDLHASLVGEGVVRHALVNMGVAVDAGRGLVVPVLKDAARRPLRDLAPELHALVEKARSGRLAPGDLQGGTFTITNLGQYGIDAFTPVINLPECAILGIGRIARRPVEQDGQLALGLTMTLSLTFDHRLVDGAPAARFLQRIGRLVEAPQGLLWD